MGEIDYERFKKEFLELIYNYYKKKFYIHLVLYIFINAFLIFTNLYYSPEEIWFVYPLVFWGLGVTLHYISLKFIKNKYELWLDIAKIRSSKF